MRWRPNAAMRCSPRSCARRWTEASCAADPDVAACHLKGLRVSENLDRFLFYVPRLFEAELNGIAARAVTMFVAAAAPPAVSA